MRVLVRDTAHTHHWEERPGPPPPPCAPSRVVRLDGRQLASGAPGPRLNAGLTRYRGRLLLAYRTGWAGAQCHLAELDEDLRVLWSRQLWLTHPRASYGREDPRLFEHAGRLHVSFIGVEPWPGGVRTSQLYARLTEGLEVERVWYLHYSERQAWEKNWSFFSRDGKLLAVYSIRPHLVLRIDGDSAEAAHETPNALPWSGGLLRGGAPPVRVGGEYWHWFHGCHGEQQGRRYNVGVSVFDAAPPFRPLRQTPDPLLEDEPATRPHDQYCPVLFPAGAVLGAGRWLVSCGVHDRWVEVHEWDAAEVSRALSD